MAFSSEKRYGGSAFAWRQRISAAVITRLLVCWKIAKIQGHNHLVAPRKCAQVESLSYHIAGSQSGGTLYCGLPFHLSGLETRRRVLPATSITSRCFWRSTIFQSAATAADWARAWFFLRMFVFSISLVQKEYATAGCERAGRRRRQRRTKSTAQRDADGTGGGRMEKNRGNMTQH